MSTANQRLRRNLLRLSLWSVPLAVATLCLPVLREARVCAALSEAGWLLLDGDGRAVRRVVDGLDGIEARTARLLADVLEGRTRDPSPDELGAVDADAYPLPLLIRSAFERGDFEAALGLTELADALGQPTLPVVTAAALIETGRTAEARAAYLGVAPAAKAPGRLAERVEQHLRTAPAEGVLLRDRAGNPLGTIRDGVLELLDGIPPELVPRAVTGVVDASAGSVRLSLDRELSAAAYDAFGRWYRGSIVLVDARNGEILAAVSDRRTFREGGTAAFEQFREPASIAKLITTTAALRAGYDPDAELAGMRCRGHQSYGGEVLYCPYVAGPLRGLDRALAVSCNVGFANLGARVGWRELVREHRRFGFDAPLGPFPGGRVLQAWGTPRELADLAIGLEESEITPLHAALLAAVFANGGKMPTPRLVISEDGRLGLHPQPLPATGGRPVIEPAWVPEILGAMAAVARRGTASHMAPPSFPVAMKTGTASHPRHGFHVNYVGVGPLPAPWLAFAVRITDRPTSRKVRIAARDVTRRFLRNLERLATRRGWVGGEPPEPRLLADGPRSPRLTRRPQPAPAAATSAAAR